MSHTSSCYWLVMWRNERHLTSSRIPSKPPERACRVHVTKLAKDLLLLLLLLPLCFELCLEFLCLCSVPLRILVHLLLDCHHLFSFVFIDFDLLTCHFSVDLLGVLRELVHRCCPLCLPKLLLRIIPFDLSFAHSLASGLHEQATHRVKQRGHDKLESGKASRASNKWSHCGAIRRHFDCSSQ